MNLSKSKKGYTLIELLVVIGIIAVLLSVMVPVIAGVVQSARLRGDQDMAKSYQSAIQLWTTQEPNEEVVYYQNLSSVITVGSYNEISYTNAFMGTKQLPGIEFKNSNEIRRATITAMKSTIKEGLETHGTEVYLHNPSTNGYGFKYYYLTGTVSVEDVSANYNKYTGENYNYYIWLDYHEGATESISTNPIAKFNKITGATSSDEAKATFAFNFSLATGQNAEYCVFEIKNDVKSYTLSGQTTTPQVFLPGSYNIRFLYNGELKYDSYVQINELHVHDSTVTVSFDGSATMQLSSNPDDFGFEVCYDGYTGERGLAINEYVGTDKTVVIPAIGPNGLKVFNVKYGTFSSNNVVEKIIFPSTLTFLENGAIYDCDNLTYIALPSPYLEYASISACDRLREVQFYNPTVALDYVRTFEDDAIMNCFEITNLTIPYLYKNIEINAFFNLAQCNNIKILLMSTPDETGSAPNPKVSNYYSSKDLLKLNPTNGSLWLAIPPLHDTPETKLRIPHNMTNAGDTQFTKYDIIRTPTEEEERQFQLYRRRYTELDIDNGYRIIDNNAFRFLTFEEIYLPITIEKIGNDAFNGNHCTSLEIPSSVTSVGDRAFASQTLQTITLKCDLSAMSPKSLEGCLRLSTILIYNYTGDPEDVTPEQFGLTHDVTIVFG